MVAKVLFALFLPHRISEAEVVDWLPAADCKALQDFGPATWGLLESLHTLISAAAEKTGD